MLGGAATHTPRPRSGRKRESSFTDHLDARRLPVHRLTGRNWATPGEAGPRMAAEESFLTKLAIGNRSPGYSVIKHPRTHPQNPPGGIARAAFRAGKKHSARPRINVQTLLCCQLWQGNQIDQSHHSSAERCTGLRSTWKRPQVTRSSRLSSRSGWRHKHQTSQIARRAAKLGANGAPANFGWSSTESPAARRSQCDRMRPLNRPPSASIRRAKAGARTKQPARAGRIVVDYARTRHTVTRPTLARKRETPTNIIPRCKAWTGFDTGPSKGLGDPLCCWPAKKGNSLSARGPASRTRKAQPVKTAPIGRAC